VIAALRRFFYGGAPPARTQFRVVVRHRVTQQQVESIVAAHAASEACRVALSARIEPWDWECVEISS
jgi:hypothetical protein